LFDVFGDENANIAIVTDGRIFGEAYKAYNKLKSEGINVKLVKLNVIVPIPEEVISSINTAHKVFFFEEGVKTGGVGESFASVMLEHKLSPEFCLTAFPDCFVKQGKTESIFRQYKLDCDGMVETIRENL
jgi:1-deoxy-D-xylulose-5-phosphate synthase